MQAWEDFGQQVVEELVRQTSTADPNTVHVAASATSDSQIAGLRSSQKTTAGALGTGSTFVNLKPRPPAIREMLQCSRLDFELDTNDSHAKRVVRKHRVHRFHPHRPSHRLPRMPPLSPPIDTVAAPSPEGGVLFDARVTHQQCNRTGRSVVAPQSCASASARDAQCRAPTELPAPRSLSNRHRQREQHFATTSVCTTVGAGDRHRHVISDMFANRSKYRRLRRAGGIADTFDPWERHKSQASASAGVVYSSNQLPAEIFMQQATTVGGAATGVQVNIGSAHCRRVPLAAMVAPTVRLPHPLLPSIKQQHLQRDTAPHEELPAFPAIRATDAHAYSSSLGTTVDRASMAAVDPLEAVTDIGMHHQPARFCDSNSNKNDQMISPTVTGVVEVYEIPPGPSRGFPVAGLPRTPRGPLL